MKSALDAELEAAPAAHPLEKILSSQRRKLFDAFMRFKQGGESDSILDVGARSALSADSASYLRAWASPQQRDCINLCAIMPAFDPGKRATNAADHGKYLRADGRHLPFVDGEFDWVFCGDIIEHAGGFERQYELLKELARVARKGVFVTTSNRWHPIEFHTVLPLLHWLPAPWWRRLLKLTGRGAWGSEAALNLLDAKGLHKLASLLPGKPEADVGHVRLCGVKAHFFLMIRKAPAASNAGGKLPEAA